MENALSTLSVMPENKAEIKTFVASFVEAAKNGYNEPLEVLKKLKILEEVAKQCKSELKEFFENESDNYSETTIEAFGCKFTKSNRTTYDFSVCNDSELEIRYKALEQAKEAVKERETMLNTLKTETVSMETGEVIHPPAKTTNSILSVTLD